MRVMIVYHSKGGHTKTLAKGVASGVQEVEEVDFVMRQVEDAVGEDMAAADAVIAGSPVYFDKMAPELKALFDVARNVPPTERVIVGGAFVTAGEPPSGVDETLEEIVHAMLTCGILAVAPMQAGSQALGVSCVGEPDEKAMRDAAALGRRVAEVVKRIGEGNSSQ